MNELAVPPTEVAFDEAAYRAWNPDVDAAIRAGTLASGRAHFEIFGRREQRPPLLVPAPTCGSPPLRAGDELRQRIRPENDWWAGLKFNVAAHGVVARLVFDCEVRREDTEEVLRTFRFDESAADGEMLVLKFPAIEAAREVPLQLRIVVREVVSSRTVQINCEPARRDDGLRFNGSAPAAMRVTFELLYAPLTLPGPTGVTLNPMTYCEGECIHCLSRTHHQRPGSLKKEWIEELRAHFRDGPGAAWCIDYATDFFNVARYRPELVELLEQKGLVSINTDGQHVTPELLRRMFALDLRRIGFSCDAATEETYAFIRKGLGRLESVFDSVRLAVKLRREANRPRPATLALSMVVMQANVHEMTRLVEIAAELELDEVWFNQLWVVSADVVEQSLMFTPERWRDGWNAALQRGSELGIGVFTGPDVRPEFKQPGISWCPEPWSGMVVLGNGDVLACASPASKIGSLRESTIEEIWNSEAYRELRRRVNSDNPPLLCQHCFIYRKPGNADGVFMHHLIDHYDLRRDLMEPGYADEARKRFTFARYSRDRARLPAAEESARSA